MVNMSPRRDGTDPDITAAVPSVLSPADLLTTHRTARLRDRLALKPGESALVLTRGPGVGSSFRLVVESITIGRRTTAGILLDDISVSRDHATITASPQGYRISDSGSLNGTYVNDIRTDLRLLIHGDEIQVGLFKLVFLSMEPPKVGDTESDVSSP